MIAILASLVLMSDPPVVTNVNGTRSENGQVQYASIGDDSTMRVTFLDRPRDGQTMSVRFEGSEAVIGSLSEWQVQLGAYDSEAIALEAWQTLTNEYDTILDDRMRFLQPVSLDDGRELVRLRASGYSDRASAIEACESLQASGQPCFVASSS